MSVSLPDMYSRAWLAQFTPWRALNEAVSAVTDRELRMFLASQGGGRKGDLSHFIEEAVRAHILDWAKAQ